MTVLGRRDRISYENISDGICRAEAYLTGRAFSPHRHDTYAVGTTTTGVQAFDYRGSTRRSLPGNVFVLHPDELHDGRAGSDAAFGYRILYIAPDLIRRAAGTDSLPYVPEPVSANPRLRAIVSRAAADGLCDSELFFADLLCILAEALCAVADRPLRRTRPTEPTVMAEVRDYLLDRLAEDVTVAGLEREFGMSRYAISRRFRRTFGVGPHRFVILRRLELAMDLVRGGMPLAEAAFASGFADQSHFTRRFRAAHGMSPARWRSLIA